MKRKSAKCVIADSGNRQLEEGEMAVPRRIPRVADEQQILLLVAGCSWSQGAVQVQVPSAKCHGLIAPRAASRLAQELRAPRQNLQEPWLAIDQVGT